MGSAMPAHRHAHVLRERWQEFCKIDQQRNHTVEELLGRLEVLEEEYEIAVLDKARERDYAREGQRRERDLQTELRKCKAQMEQDPFVLVLIDGDGMIFDNSLLQKGEQGGRDAASYLFSGIRDYISLNLSEVSNPKIVARVYANVKGLSETCYKAGIIERNVFEDFVRGFTCSRQLFDFIDVGAGKDRADDKLTEMSRLHLNDCHCRQIVLGCSHDNGYARLLEEMLGDSILADKFTLLEGVPFEKELAIMVNSKAFKSAKFEGLFRGEKIVVKPNYMNGHEPSPMHQFSQFAQRPAMPSVSSPSPVGQIISPPITPATSNHPGLARTTSNASSSPSVSVATPAPAGSWAYAAKQAPPVVSTPTTDGKATDQNQSKPPNAADANANVPIRRNKYGQRVDMPLPLPPKEEMNRIKKLKLCNLFMLRGECAAGSACHHDHSKRLSPSEMTTLRYIARMAPCKLGLDCEDPMCTHGHICPQSEVGKKDCWYGESCFFPRSLHGIDMQVVKTYKV